MLVASNTGPAPGAGYELNVGLGQWTPPIQVATQSGPAPGTGYDSWWKDPLGDLIEGATDKLRGELELDAPDTSLSIDAPIQRAGIAGTGLSMTDALLWGGFVFGALQLALNYAAVKKPRRARR